MLFIQKNHFGNYTSTVLNLRKNAALRTIQVTFMITCFFTVRNSIIVDVNKTKI